MAGIRDATDQHELFYNGFKFPPAIVVRHRAECVYDESGRQVAYVVHRLDVECILHEALDAPDATGTYNPTFPAATAHNQLLDAEMLNLRARLLEPGGHLVYNGAGHGGLRTLGTDNVDVKFGPKPISCEITNLGAGRAARLFWSVEVHVSECHDPVGLLQGLIAHNSTHEWDVDEFGFVTRIIDGYIEVSNNRRATPTRIARGQNATTGELVDVGTTDRRDRNEYLRIRNSADAPIYAPLYDYPKLPGFKRTFSRRLSQDRTRLDYTVTDEEIKSQQPYPEKVIEADIRQRTATDNFCAGKRWTMEIGGTIKVARDTPLSFAWLAFMKIVASRRRLARQHGRRLVKRTSMSGKEYEPEARPAVIITRHFSFEEALFSPEMSFRVLWEIACDRQFIFRAAGVGQPIDANWQWEDWAEGIEWKQKGLTQLAFNPSTDLLLGMCDPGFLFYQQQLKEGKIPEEKYTGDVIGTDPNPPPLESWSQFFVKPEVREYQDRVPYHILEPDKQSPGENQYPGPGGDEDSEGNEILPKAIQVQGSYELNAPPDGQQPVIHARGPRKYELIVTGFAERVRYGIPRPIVLKYRGAEAWPVGTAVFRHWEDHDRVNGTRITRALWHQRYYLNRKPDDENPVPGTLEYD